MLSLQIDGKPVHLDNDFSFTLNLINPIFNALTSYSYPFKMPNTPLNKAILGFRHRIESTTDPYLQNPATFLWNGHILFSGVIFTQISDKDHFEGSIINDPFSFYNLAKNLLLTQIDMGSLDFDNEAEALSYFNSTGSGKFPQSAIAFPFLFNDEYLDPATDNTQLKFINDWHTWDQSYRLMLLTESPHPGLRTNLVPMLYIQYIYTRIAKQLGYDLIDDLFTSHDDLSRLVLFNSLNCNNCQVGNRYFDVTKIDLNDHVPSIFISDFLTSIQNYFCSVTFIDGIKNKIRIVPIKNILLDPTYIEFSKNITLVQTALEDHIFGYSLSMELDGDDDKLANLKILDGNFAATVKGYVQNRIDLPAWPIGQIGDSYYVEDDQCYYFMDPTKNWQNFYSAEWQLQSQFMFKDAIKEPKQSTSSKLSTLHMNVNAVDPNGNPINLCMECGNKLEDWKKIVPRLLFTIPKSYTLIDIHYNYTDSNNATDNFSLFYPGAKGLFEKFWKEYLNFKVSARLVKIEKQMSFAELANFDFSRKYRINGIKYLIKDIQVCIKKDTIQPAILECYPCP
jgi:hypothetical protein